ncbi:TonB family protein [Gilvimarinus agarilyticus]|uniref:TonB family protein n=1 Tax=Gilvimarinus agarilyticus TaxID=679259 RepID=UPI00059F559F|nr:TonB family protein [Gilvimarinus agarilyticus]
MRTLRIPVYWILALLFFSVNGAVGAPLLNGMAVHQELSRDQFIGALYSETLSSDASELLAADQPMRMELKITAERGIAARKFSRMWIEGMAINIRGSALTEQADNMVAFTTMFQERLLENDHVVFALNPGEGVAFSVNSITLGTIPDDNFFGLLLSTWLGRVPLSSTYREQLLVSGDVSASLTSRYASISPTAERIDQVALWGAPEPEPEPEPAPEPEQEVAVAPVVVPATTVAKPKIEIPPTPSAIANNTAEASSQAARVESSIPAVASSSSSVASSAAPVVPKEESVDESDEDFVPTFTAESILASQRYFSNLVRKVQGEISYPRRAMQRGYEGSIRIAISIDRQGELLSAALIEETEYSVLNDEAMDAVESAEPFTEVPEVITGQVHEFTIPITFQLQQQ